MFMKSSIGQIPHPIYPESLVIVLVKIVIDTSYSEFF